MLTELPRAAVARPDPAAESADAIRAFNRYELKYLADPTLVARFRAAIGSRVDRDRHGVGGLYPVWSRYYDTRDLAFYWQKIDGIRFRRKLRIRHYGPPDALEGDTAVWVEIKQRLGRVTQKRRLRLPYAAALRLCAGERPVDLPDRDDRVAQEIVGLVSTLALRPTTVVGYVREAFTARGEDRGLRVTIDSRVRGRDRDLELGADGANRYIVHPALSVIEIKVNERVPYWLTELIARNTLQLVRLSKYCQSIQAFGAAPRSVRVAHEG